jgi:hypothetical protein
MAQANVLPTMSAPIERDEPQPEAAPKAAPPSQRTRIFFLVKALISAFLLYKIGGLIFAQRGAESLGETLGQLRWEWIALGLGVHLVQRGVRTSARWRTLLKSDRASTPPLRFARRLAA